MADARTLENVSSKIYIYIYFYFSTSTVHLSLFCFIKKLYDNTGWFKKMDSISYVIYCSIESIFLNHSVL